ncbi:MAG: 16S rRNA (cytosine(1402)-N(4))-methyltransferase RsmH [Acidobacteriota bacterium]
MTQIKHIPVLLEEVLEYLDAERPGIYLDGTIGLGGHTLEILRRNPQAKVIGFDLDESTLLEARKKLRPYSDRIELYHSDFRYIPDLKLDFTKVKGLLLDLGVSSFQLDNPERGLSYQHEGPLDMRMDTRNKTTASRILNRYSERNLTEIFRKYGELRQAKRLARAIASLRKNEKINSTSQLLNIVENVCHWRPQKGKTHPAARVFQALRIEVNQELTGVSHFLERITMVLKKGTRLVVISFHSLEDRIIKRTFNRLASPVDSSPLLQILTKKPVTPEENEIISNFRSRSAKLRAAERL